MREPVPFPRQPPIVSPHDVSLLEPAIGGRVHLTDRFTVRATYGWSPTSTFHFAYDRPPQYPPLTSYTSEMVVRDRHQALALVPSFDLIVVHHVRPWIGGGVAWRWSTEEDTFTFTDFLTSVTSVIRTTGEDTERMILAEGGVRFPIAARLIAGASARENFWRTTPASIPQVPPRSRRFMLDVSAGVVF